MLGLGLIGGSVARAAVAAGLEVVAWTPDGRGPGRAAIDGIEPAASLALAIDGAELVVLAAPPLACLALVDELGGRLDEGGPAGPVVTDVSSTKAAIIERARARGLRFVGGHPMAGRETSGYGSSDVDLLRSRPWVVVPPEPADPEAESRVVALATACGAVPVRMGAVEHDRAVAMISHLPLVVAAALVETAVFAPDWSVARSLAAGGWAGMTRLAGGSPEMGAGILATNSVEIADRLRAFRAVLDDWIVDLDGLLAGEEADDGAAGGAEPALDRLRSRLAAARLIVEAGSDP